MNQKIFRLWYLQWNIYNGYPRILYFINAKNTLYVGSKWVCWRKHFFVLRNGVGEVKKCHILFEWPLMIISLWFFEILRPRTRPAIAVIFAEDPNILSFGRFKRSLLNNLRRNQRRPTFFSRFFNLSHYSNLILFT